MPPWDLISGTLTRGQSDPGKASELVERMEAGIGEWGWDNFPRVAATLLGLREAEGQDSEDLYMA